RPAPCATPRASDLLDAPAAGGFTPAGMVPAVARAVTASDPPMDQTSAQSGHELLTTNRKALVINLDETRYGTFAEIGAGQEVARHFFQAGGAAGTIAKTMSAYDMAFSDAIYGKSQR